MSYDLEIRSDEHFTQSKDLQSLHNFITHTLRPNRAL